MKVLKIYNQHRRDCWIDLECEKCGYKETYKGAYDDRNYWDNVVPSFECEKCKESSNSLGITNEKIKTKYHSTQKV